MGNDWFKMHSCGWLTGSIRAQLTPAERSVWADLLAMANESRVCGKICRASTIPYSRAYIAAFLEIPLELLNSTIAKCLEDRNEDADDPRTRIMFDEYGCIVITNWAKYQSKPESQIEKEQKRADAIEKAKRTNKSKDNAIVATTRAVNELKAIRQTVRKE